jgi:hypothetical protein
VQLDAWIQVRDLDRQKMTIVYHVRVVHVNGNVVFRLLCSGPAPSHRSRGREKWEFSRWKKDGVFPRGNLEDG